MSALTITIVHIVTLMSFFINMGVTDFSLFLHHTKKGVFSARAL